MKRSAAEIVREYGPSPGAASARRQLRRRARLVRRRRQAERLRSGERARRCARSTSPAHAGTAFDGRHLFQIAEDRIQKIDPDTGQVLATIPSPGGGGLGARLGRRVRSGSGSIGTGRSIRSIPRPGRSFAPSSPTASSPGSPGSTANSGTAPGKATRASCGESIRKPARCWRSSTCRPASAYRGWSPTAATSSFAAEEAAARCGWSGSQGGAEWPLVELAFIVAPWLRRWPPLPQACDEPATAGRSIDPSLTGKH